MYWLEWPTQIYFIAPIGSCGERGMSTRLDARSLAKTSASLRHNQVRLFELKAAIKLVTVAWRYLADFYIRKVHNMLSDWLTSSTVIWETGIVNQSDVFNPRRNSISSFVRFVRTVSACVDSQTDVNDMETSMRLPSWHTCHSHQPLHAKWRREHFEGI